MMTMSKNRMAKKQQMWSFTGYTQLMHGCHMRCVVMLASIVCYTETVVFLYTSKSHI